MIDLKKQTNTNPQITLHTRYIVNYGISIPTVASGHFCSIYFNSCNISATNIYIYIYFSLCICSVKLVKKMYVIYQ